jgi:hypothetical protein
MSLVQDLLLFCDDLSRNPCASNVFRELVELPGIANAGAEFDGFRHVLAP